MKKVAVLPKEKVEAFRIYYERKQSINDLCRTLAYNNATFQENESAFYKRLIQDNQKCLAYLNHFWDECQKTYHIQLKPEEEMYVDFFSNELGIREIVQ